MRTFFIIKCIVFYCNFCFSQNKFSTKDSSKIGIIGGTTYIINKANSNGIHLGLLYQQKLKRGIFVSVKMINSFLSSKKSINAHHETDFKMLQEFPVLLCYKPFSKKITPFISAGLSGKYFLDDNNIYPIKLYAEAALDFEVALRDITISPGIRYSAGKSFNAMYVSLNLKN